MRNVDVRRTVAALLTILISLTATPANAKCKFNVDTVHSITGEKVLWTKWQVFSFGSSTGAYIAGTIGSTSDAVVGSGASYGDKKFFALRVTRPASMVKMEMDSALVTSMVRVEWVAVTTNSSMGSVRPGAATSAAAMPR